MSERQHQLPPLNLRVDTGFLQRGLAKAAKQLEAITLHPKPLPYRGYVSPSLMVIAGACAELDARLRKRNEKRLRRLLMREDKSNA